MTPPPVMDEKERKLRQNQRELHLKQQQAVQKRMQSFREEVTKKINRFDTDDNEGPRLKFDAMDKIHRSIIHDIAESASLVALSFGEDEVDRHVIVFRQHTVPTEPELVAMRRNEVYIPPPAEDSNHEDEPEEVIPTGTKKKLQPEYLQKYQKHLGGLAVAKDAAKTTVVQRSYGFVSSEQKKDKRTIEETLADIRARKRQKADTDFELPSEQE